MRTTVVAGLFRDFDWSTRRRSVSLIGDFRRLPYSAGEPRTVFRGNVRSAKHDAPQWRHAWQLQQDLESPNHFRMEMVTASWSEHLRQHERMTNPERQALERAGSFDVDGYPVPAKHFLSVDREVFLFSQKVVGRNRQ